MLLSLVLDLPSSLDILTLSLAISSSAVAILSGRGLQEFFKRKNEERIAKSALVSYLAKIQLEILTVSSRFRSIAGMRLPPAPEVLFTHPKLVGELEVKRELEETDKLLQLRMEDVVNCPDVDTEYYEKTSGNVSCIFLATSLGHL